MATERQDASRELLVRALWTLFEPIHALTYFSTQSRHAFAAIGLTRFWDGYFAGRAAPLGAVEAAPVAAIFSGFSPTMINRALPSAWSIASVESILEARSVGAATTIRALYDPVQNGGDQNDPDSDKNLGKNKNKNKENGRTVARAADALALIAAGIDTIGRPLAAANQALPVESDPYRRLWQATATLREHRGDGHVIALVSGNIAGLSTIVLRSAIDLDPATMKRARGWDDEQWAAEESRLVGRGLLNPDCSLSREGLTALNTAEALTNRLALGPWQHLNDDGLRDIADLLRPIAVACASLYPHPNPIGMPEPWDPVEDPDATSVPETIRPKP